MRFYLSETGFPKILVRLFLAPHRTEPLAVLRRGHRHAVHGGNGIQESTDRVTDVLMYMTRSLDILHEIPSIGFQCTMDPPQDIQRFALVMNGIWRGRSPYCGVWSSREERWR